MQKTALRKDILPALEAEAIRLGDELIALAHPTAAGWNWSSLTVDGKEKYGKVIWQEAESLYSGSAGVVFVLLALYRHTKAPRFLAAARAGAAWLVSQSQQEAALNYSFYTGRLGTAYVLCQLHELTREPEYLEQALETTRGLKTSPHLDDLLAGNAGVLLGLLHLHRHTQAPWIVDVVNTQVEYFLRKMQVGEQGVFWCRNLQAIHAQCGVGHGNSGVAWVLLELGRYFGNDAYHWLAKMACLYETSRFKPSIGNWPDLRLFYYSQSEFDQVAERYLQGDEAFFTRETDMNAWCYGAVGIGLVRLRGYALTQDDYYREESRLALRKSAKVSLAQNDYRHQVVYEDIQSPQASDQTDETGPLLPSFTLCHGLGGNGDLFLEAYRVLGDSADWEAAVTLAQQALTLHQQTGFYQSGLPQVRTQQDTSLLMGNAGIAYFFLQVVDPTLHTSILLPAVPGAPRPPARAAGPQALGLSLQTLQSRVISQVYKRTCQLVQVVAPAEWQAFVAHLAQQRECQVVPAFERALAQWLPALTAETRAVVADIYALEHAKRGLENAVVSDAMLCIKDQMTVFKKDALTHIPTEVFLDFRLTVDADTRLITTSWPWGTADAVPTNLHRPSGQHHTLIRANAMGVSETPLQPLMHSILSCFSSPKHVREVVSEILVAVGSRQKGDVLQLSGIIIQQIRSSVLAGFLQPIRPDHFYFKLA